MVEGSRTGFLERLAAFYAILADLRNCLRARLMAQAFSECKAAPNARMVTPAVVEIIAVR